MAESPSSALPGGVQWLPALGGAHLLRAELGRGDPPALILQSNTGDEHRIEPGPQARFSRVADYLVPTGVRWSVASLLWPDGTRALLPNPPDARGEVIPLPTRRARPEPEPEPAASHWTAPPAGGTPPAAPPPNSDEATADRGTQSGLASPGVSLAPRTPRSDAVAPGAAERAAVAPLGAAAPDVAAPDGAAPLGPAGLDAAAADGDARTGAAPFGATEPDVAAPLGPAGPDAAARTGAAPFGATEPDVAAPLGPAGTDPAARTGAAPFGATEPDVAAPLGPAGPDPAAADGVVRTDAAPSGTAARGVASPAGATVAPASGAPAAVAPFGVAASGVAAPRGATAASLAAASSLAARVAATPPRDGGPIDVAAPGAAAASSGAPRTADADGAASGWRERRAVLERDLVHAAEAVLQARESERETGEAVLSVLAGAHADLQAVRAARAADAKLLATLTGQLEAERGAHAATRRATFGDDVTLALRAQLEHACHDAAAARLEVDALRAQLDAERTARARAETALGRALTGHEDLKRHASAQAQVAATAPRRAPADSTSLIAALDAAANSLRATVPARDVQADEAAAPSHGLPTRPAPSADAATSDLAEAAPAAASAPAPTRDLAPAPSAAASAPAATRDLAPAPSAAASAPAATRDLAPAPSAAASAPAATPIDSSPADQSDAAATRSGNEIPPVATLSLPEAGAVLLTPPSRDPVAAPIGLTQPPVGATARAPVTVETSPWRLGASPATALVVPDVQRPGLLQALVALAREDTVAAGGLLAGLLPAQGAVLGTDITYDLTIRGVGTFAVTVRDGTASVRRIARRRPRREAAFHLQGDPLLLAELLAGERHRIKRFGRGGVKVNRRRKRARPLVPLRDADLTLADLARAGARLEPALVYRALPFAIAPEWTRGHVFTVAQQIVELAPRAWYVTARDGVALTVVEHTAGCAADATVTMSRAAFERLLRAEPAAAGDLPTVRGNRHAVAALKRWTELAAGA